MTTQADPASWHLARGFRFAGLSCGIRANEPDRRDLALAVSDGPATAAGVFTRNRVRAAPVRVCQERLPSGDVRGVIACSGNANACTGPQGLADARRMAALAASAAGCRDEQFLVASTGVIGRHLPMPKIEEGISRIIGTVGDSSRHLEEFARSILTTDKVIKVATRAITLGGVEVRLTGVCKGAAMIGPNMATMLGFIFTDAAIAPNDLQLALRRATEQSFNCLSVEGHTSTNDTVLVLANGKAGGTKLANDDLGRFAGALAAVCGDLARGIAHDAEGANHFVTIEVEGTRDDAEAHKIAKAIADSALVKTAIFGCDPNWGRIVSAAGYAGVVFEEEDVSLWLGDLPLYERGAPLPFDAKTASAYLRHQRDVVLRLRFTLGTGRCTFWTSDLTHEYVTLNADRTT